MTKTTTRLQPKNPTDFNHLVARHWECDGTKTLLPSVP